MEFVEPFFLWGGLAVMIPVLIHLWHQKRGKPLPWAATQWLAEKDNLQSRGLRLDNVLLLILRCLLLILLTILLSQLILKGLIKQQTVQKIHLVQPNPLIMNNFRFELEEASKKGEKVYQMDQTLTPLSDKASQTSAPIDALTLQAAINKLPYDHTELHVYLVNNQLLADVPAITVPARFQLHTLVDSIAKPRAFLTVKDNKRLFVNQAGRLTSSAVNDPTLKFQPSPAHAGPIRVLLTYQNPRERQTVRAALAALADVYALDLSIDEQRRASENYDLIGLDNWRAGAQTQPKSLYIVSAIEQSTAPANVIFTNESLTPQTSERVANGQLPEWLGEQLIDHYGLRPAQFPLSQRALNTLFVPNARRNSQQQPIVQNLLLLLFVVILLFERWLALTKNV